jgi:hypothetical protein
MSRLRWYRVAGKLRMRRRDRDPLMRRRPIPLAQRPGAVHDRKARSDGHVLATGVRGADAPDVDVHGRRYVAGPVPDGRARAVLG